MGSKQEIKIEAIAKCPECGHNKVINVLRFSKRIVAVQCPFCGTNYTYQNRLEGKTLIDVWECIGADPLTIPEKEHTIVNFDKISELLGGGIREDKED